MGPFECESNFFSNNNRSFNEQTLLAIMCYDRQVLAIRSYHNISFDLTHRNSVVYNYTSIVISITHIDITSAIRNVARQFICIETLSIRKNASPFEIK